MHDAAYEVWETFGKGGNPEAPIPEEYIGCINTPPTTGGYVRVKFDEYYANALEYLQSIGGADTIDLIMVEREGQTKFIVDTETQEELGYIAGMPVHQES